MDRKEEKLRELMQIGVTYADLHTIRQLATQANGCCVLDAGHMEEIGRIATIANRLIDVLMKAADSKMAGY